MTDWLALAQALPDEPGVYTFRGPEGDVLYVGKATSLKSRVSQYFQEGTSDYREFIQRLQHELGDIETAVTRSPKEALILERELIRKHEPRYNVIWRDDKQYLCLRVDTKHPYPWVQVVRNMGRDGARYFGPFHSASSARQTLRVVNRYFQLRTCRDSVLNSRTRPCLEYQIGRCPAPCVIDVDKAEYRRNIDDALMFLEGRGQTLVKRLERRMWQEADKEAFEVAARLRDQIRAVERTLERQHVAMASMRDQDVIGLFTHGEDRCIAILEVRDGRIRDVRSHLFAAGFDEGDVLESFLLQFYASRDDVPAEVLVPQPLDSAGVLGELLGERRGRKVSVVFPQRGERMRMIELARDNAEHAYYERRRKAGAMRSTLQGLERRLRLQRAPHTIECFDISNLQGGHVVGSQVRFRGGLPDKRRYRRYRVKSVEGQDDFGAMYEVLSRRLSRGVKDRDLPDLIVIDGGKGQLKSAMAAMSDRQVTGVDLVSLAKARTLSSDEDDAPKRSPERVFLVGAKEPIVMPQSSAEVRLLAAVRDEAHRFAVTFHEKSRRKSKLTSELDSIPGVGPARKKALLKHLGSLKRVVEASVQDLAAVPGIGPAAARRIHEHLHRS